MINYECKNRFHQQVTYKLYLGLGESLNLQSIDFGINLSDIYEDVEL